MPITIHQFTIYSLKGQANEIFDSIFWYGMRPGSQQPILKMFTKAFKGTVSQRHVNSYSPNTGLHFAFLKKVLGFKNLNNLEKS